MPITNLAELLLHATYQDGVVLPSRLTEPHARAEKHPYKTQHLFRKGKKIPRNLYVARLIEHYAILKALENKLKQCRENADIAPFFALNFSRELARTPVISNDLEQLGVRADRLSLENASAATRRYIGHVSELKEAKAILVHYALHIAGLMHGGRIIQNEFFNPSNRLPGYQIPNQEYDFSAANRAAGLLANAPATQLFGQMSKGLEGIKINEQESQSLLGEGLLLYSAMAELYDDLLWKQVHFKNLLYCMACSAVVLLAGLISKCAILTAPDKLTF